MFDYVALFLMAAGVVGVVALIAQFVLVLWWRARTTSPSAQGPGISILKPLCGIDDDLVGNLESLLRQDHPEFEVLLGVKDEKDAAFPLALRFATQHPDVFRLVLQRREVGLNPKVNQLVSLAAAARYEVLHVSDSNVSLQPGFLTELSAHFAEEDVACVTHPIVGVGERSFGAMLESLHLAATIGAGMISAPMASGNYLVVGKSMALRRSALERIGGFAPYANHLAEDYVIGRALQQAGLRVVVARLPCQNQSGDKSIGAFWRRYARWSVIHRTAVARSTYFAQALMNPVPLLALGVLLLPSAEGALVLAVVTVLKAALDVTLARALRDQPLPGFYGVLVVVKDALLFGAWVRGLFVRTVDWRGNALRVGEGSLLLAAQEDEVEEVAVA